MLAVVIAGPACCPAQVLGQNPARPLRIVVADPLCQQLACACVAGYAQRDYQQLAQYLQAKLDREVHLAYAEALTAETGAGGPIDLVVGKFSVVLADAERIGLAVRPLALLSGSDGAVTQSGLFVVRRDDAARSMEDLAGRRFLFGPADADEKHAAAFATLEAFDLPLPRPIVSKPSCSAAALAVAEQDADVALVSSYAMPLLEGCGTIQKGELRVVGGTDPVPFIGVFATPRVDPQQEQPLWAALSDVREHRRLLAALESRDGFVRLPSGDPPGNGPRPAWKDWRGPDRAARSPDVPTRLPDPMRLLWSRTMTGPGMSGLAIDEGRLVVADKDLEGTHDIFRCLDADTGRERWKIRYPAAGRMDFTNSPRANPVIRRGLVYLLGAFGDLRCLQLATGRTVWQRNLADDFDAERPAWGYCSTPLLVGDRLIVNPGAADASLVALDRLTGRELWRAAGRRPGYASFLLATLGGRQQVVGYDAVSLGGWDPQTGKRLWELIPEWEGDFNVPTPIAVNGSLLVSTENNGTRLYGFAPGGRIQPNPQAVNPDLAPDTSTPVAVDGLVLGSFGGLFCLDLEDDLRTLWVADEDDLVDYCSLIAGNGHTLVTTQGGRLYLLKNDPRQFQAVAKLDLFQDLPSESREVWSHPALVGNRLYVRNLLAVYCFLLE